LCLKLVQSWSHKSFTFKGSQEWNSLPSEIRTLKSSAVFRTKLRTYMLDKDNCSYSFYHVIINYRNSLRCKNIFVHRKCTKIFYANIILQRKIFDIGWLRATHQNFPNCCCPYILVYMVASNTTSNLF